MSRLPKKYNDATVPPRLCACGCGGYTAIARDNIPKLGHVRGQRVKWRSGHSKRRVTVPFYPSTTFNGRSQSLHRIRAEAALGKPLPPGAVVHHADGSMDPNAPLVICENHKYHELLHVRMRIVKAGGDPNTEKICSHCKQVKHRGKFGKDRHNSDGLHSECLQCRSETRRKRPLVAA